MIKKGVVAEIPPGSDQVVVQAGIIKTRVPLSNLRLLEEKPVQAPKRRVTKQISSRRTGGSMELDLRGQTVLDALLEIDRFLDSAVLTGLHQVTIIHGKGTGALRKAVQDHLKRHPAVKQYRLGTFGEGRRRRDHCGTENQIAETIKKQAVPSACFFMVMYWGKGRWLSRFAARIHAHALALAQSGWRRFPAGC